MRLIDADALKEKIECYIEQITGYTDVVHEIMSDVFRSVVDDIKDMRTIDAEPVKHGEWLEWELFSTNSRWYRYECSCCGEKYNKDITYWKFCPECGADMRG